MSPSQVQARRGIPPLLSGFASPVTLKPDQGIWEAGAPAEFALYIQEGGCEVFRVTHGGTEYCVGIFGPGDMIGLSSANVGVPFPCAARSLSCDTKALKLLVRQAQFRWPDGEMALELNRWTTHKISQHEGILRDKIHILSSGRTSDRLFAALTHLRRRFGTTAQTDQVEISIALTKTLLARFIDSRVETVIRTLSVWQKEGLIEFQKNSVTIPHWGNLQSVAITES